MPSIQFHCPSCQTKLSAEPDQAGTPGVCPECEWTFYIPKNSQGPSQEAVVRFFCPHCSRKLSATADQFATEMPCPYPDCRKPVLVPRPNWKSMPTTILKRGGSNPRTLVSEGESLTRSSLKKGEE